MHFPRYITIICAFTFLIGCSPGNEDSLVGAIDPVGVDKAGFDLPTATGSNPLYTFTEDDWEGQYWSFNISLGPWFPTVGDNPMFATFGIDDYSWGQLRSRAAINPGNTIHIHTTLLLNSGGVNGDAAIFAFGESWAHYEGNAMGIILEDGLIRFCKTTAGTIDRLDVIGHYSSGDHLNLKLTLEQDGSLSVAGPGFHGHYSPDITISSYRFLISSKDSSPDGGFTVGPTQLMKNKKTAHLNQTTTPHD